MPARIRRPVGARLGAPPLTPDSAALHPGLNPATAHPGLDSAAAGGAHACQRSLRAGIRVLIESHQSPLRHNTLRVGRFHQTVSYCECDGCSGFSRDVPVPFIRTHKPHSTRCESRTRLCLRTGAQRLTRNVVKRGAIFIPAASRALDRATWLTPLHIPIPR